MSCTCIEYHFYLINYTINLGDQYVGIAVVKAENPKKAEEIFLHDSYFNGYRNQVKITKIEEIPSSVLPTLEVEEYMRTNALEILNINDIVVKKGVGEPTDEGGEIFNDYINNKALAKNSHAEGYKSQANAEAAHSEGYNCRSIGTASHSEGYFTITSNPAEHAEGRFNTSFSNLISSVGIGNSTSDRQNAVSILREGDIYIKGIGNYDGKLLGGSKSLQTIIEENTDTAKEDRKYTALNLHSEAPFRVHMATDPKDGTLYKSYRCEFENKAKLYESTDGKTWKLLYQMSGDYTKNELFCGDNSFGVVYIEGKKYIVSIVFRTDNATDIYVYDVANKVMNKKSYGGILTNEESGFSDNYISEGKIICYKDNYYFLGYNRNNLHFSPSGCWRKIAIFKITNITPTGEFSAKSKVLIDFTDAPGPEDGNWGSSLSQSMAVKAMFIDEPDCSLLGDTLFTVIRTVGNSHTKYNTGGIITSFNMKDIENSFSSTFPFSGKITYTNIYGAPGNENTNIKDIKGAYYMKECSYGGHLNGMLPKIESYYNDDTILPKQINIILISYIRTLPAAPGSIQYNTEANSLNLMVFNLGADAGNINPNVWKRISESKKYIQINPSRNMNDINSPQGGNSGCAISGNNLYIYNPQDRIQILEEFTIPLKYISKMV